jgi:hypothetical protein
MVKGLEVFRDYFAGQADQFVFIGGTAATLAMADAGLAFRATKDLDIVLHIEALTSDFRRTPGQARQGLVPEALQGCLARDHAAVLEDPSLSKFAGRVSDSRDGRWTIKAGIDEGVPTPVLTTALYERFSSRGNAEFQDKLLSAMR